MSDENRNKPEIDWRDWLLRAITDLTIGIILMILNKIF